MLALDHIAVACGSLDEGRRHVESALGVSLEAGGQHARFGSHNLLLGLADGIYLEVIAIDPDAPAPKGARWFALDRFTGGPRVTNWICRTDGMAKTLDRFPYDMGPVERLRRGDLEWDMAAANGELPYDQGAPAIIDWGKTPHPSSRLAQSGLRLEKLEIFRPAADRLARDMAPFFDDPRVVFQPGENRMRATFSGPDGPKVLL
ncbi:MAG: polyphosphate kinase [Rhodobacterales bacterium]|nr:MAG: polyphosphate kinase [Rhodobacterales bacterium]